MPRPSVIDSLPAEVRGRIDAFLRHRDSPITVDQFVTFLRDDLGLDVARSTAGRHMQKWEHAARRVRRVREFAESMSLDLEGGKEDKILRSLAETVAELAMTMMDRVAEDEVVDPKDLANLGRMVKDLSQGLRHGAERELRLRAEMAKKAEAAVERVAKRRGLSAEAVADLKSEFLGM